MSLGFSLKDFLTVTNLISNISGSLKSAGGSSSDYQELVRELDLLQRALTDIEHLTGPPSELPSINAIKCAALNCQYVLDEFAGKLQKYEKSLGNGIGESKSAGHGSRGPAMHLQLGGKRKRGLGEAREKVNDNVKKVEWELFMKEEVRDLRAYLTSHVGSLNMRMITQGLSTASIAAKKAEDNRTKLELKLEELREGIKTEFKAQELILEKTNTLLDKVIDLVNDEIAPQLKEHGTSNIQILDIVKSLQSRLPDPDIRFTWFQDPCRLEDARGHNLPIPSEFGYDLVQAIIKALFKTGPGHRFVRAGDYQLSNIKNSNHLILGSKGSRLIPGMNIRMAIVLNKLPTGRGKVCPMPFCRSGSPVNAAGGGHTCSDCGVWFAEACKIETTTQIQEITDSSEDEPKAKRARKWTKKHAINNSEEEGERLELASIKNIRVPGNDESLARLPSEPQYQESRSKPLPKEVIAPGENFFPDHPLNLLKFPRWTSPPKGTPTTSSPIKYSPSRTHLYPRQPLDIPKSGIRPHTEFGDRAMMSTLGDADLVQNLSIPSSVNPRAAPFEPMLDPYGTPYMSPRIIPPPKGKRNDDESETASFPGSPTDSLFGWTTHNSLFGKTAEDAVPNGRVSSASTSSPPGETSSHYRSVASPFSDSDNCHLTDSEQSLYLNDLKLTQFPRIRQLDWLTSMSLIDQRLEMLLVGSLTSGLALE